MGIRKDETPPSRAERTHARNAAQGQGARAHCQRFATLLLQGTVLTRDPAAVSSQIGGLNPF